MRQIGCGGMPFYKGRDIQYGNGLGSFFRRIYKWIAPIARKHILPIAQNVGSNLVNNAANIAKDAIQGENIKSSAKKRLSESLTDLTQSAKDLKRKVIPGVESLGSEVLSGVSNFATDTINGVDPKQSAKVRFNETLNNLSQKAGVLNGEGIKRRAKTKKSKKRNTDIFDI
jgi:hypothetical protein